MIYIKNAIIIDPKQKKEIAGNLLIQDNKILKIYDREKVDEQEIEKNLLAIGFSQKDQVIDGAGKYIGPGLVDVHVHFRDPGLTHKEDIFTGAKAAARGGVTTVVLMANTKPAVDSVETLSYVLEKGKQTDIHVKSCGTITMGMQGKELTDMEALLQNGAAGLTDDGIPILEESIVKAAMEKAVALEKKLGRKIPLSFHEENPQYITNNGINRGEASKHFGIGGSDRMAEISMVKRDLELAKQTGACFDVQHISTLEAVELVREAKKTGGNNIHAEATPHHLMLTEEAAIEYKTYAKMNPPLRTKADREAVILGVLDGTIDMIATDHAPHTKEEKDQDITKAPSGIIGLETSFACAVTVLVKEYGMKLVDLFDRLSLAPARMYGFDTGYIAQGAVADLIVFDPNEQITFHKFLSKSSNTPFQDKTMYGKIEMTICDGKIIYDANVIS